jgi:hypothetical protein
MTDPHSTLLGLSLGLFLLLALILALALIAWSAWYAGVLMVALAVSGGVFLVAGLDHLPRHWEVALCSFRQWLLDLKFW